MSIDVDRITVQDCLELFELKGIVVNIGNGNVTGFTDEE